MRVSNYLIIFRFLLLGSDVKERPFMLHYEVGCVSNSVIAESASVTWTGV